jgi:hypothetical protein
MYGEAQFTASMSSLPSPNIATPPLPVHRGLLSRSTSSLPYSTRPSSPPPPPHPPPPSIAASELEDGEILDEVGETVTEESFVAETSSTLDVPENTAAAPTAKEVVGDGVVNGDAKKRKARTS